MRLLYRIGLGVCLWFCASVVIVFCDAAWIEIRRHDYDMAADSLILALAGVLCFIVIVTRWRRG